MRTKTLAVGTVAVLFIIGNAFAQMGGGHMGAGMGGRMGGATGLGRMGGGMGYGMGGAGGMASGLMQNTMSHGYSDVLDPLNDEIQAREAIQAFIDSSNSRLQISELWEYETAYVAELSDINQAKAFDVVADKFTGFVMPQMGFSMMMNASYGRNLYKMPLLGRNLNLASDQAATKAEDFISANGLDYLLGAPETYPGYYKFHTTSGGNFGMDIMVNGYNGRIWMNTLLGLPVAQY